MTIYKIVKSTLPKMSSSNSCIAKKFIIRHITVLEARKGVMHLVKRQIDHNKNKKHNVTRNHKNQDTIENMRVIPYQDQPSKTLIPY